MQDTELPEKIEPTSLNFQTELAAQLVELVPEIMSDGKLDVAKLREMINGDAENSPEKFGLFWPGKRAAQALAQIPTSATLIPVPEESVDWDNTKNLFIEGDNLEVLKALQNSYRRKIKMIYIDPPYNTGKEFIYPDKFSEGLQGYLEYTGQKNEAGEKVESKPETGGRRHSNWLSMIYPRLQLAKSLLSDDGVIFISIDDNEQANLIKLCDEIFGEENFIESFVWQKKTQPSFLSKEVASVTEYIIAYKRSSDQRPLKGGETDISRTSEMINIGNPVGERILPKEIVEFENGRFTGFLKAGEYGKGVLIVTLLEDVMVKNGRPANDIRIRAKIVQSQSTINDGAKNGWKIFIKRTDSMRPTIDKNRSEAGIRPPISLLSKKLDSKIPTNTDASNEIKSLFDGVNIMDYPKPSDLIKFLVDAATFDDKNAIIVDFFSGSGTTAHSVMKLNADDNGSRTNIQVQLPEVLENKSEAFKAGYKTIADIAKERIRRAGKKVCEDYKDKIAQRSTPIDTGFRVYKLAPSNFVQWDENRAKDDIQQSVLDFAANKKTDAAPESLLTEIMLQARMPLSANIEKRGLQSGSWVYIVDGGNLIAYVANEQITEAQANEIADLAPAKLIVLDSAFNGNNALKINVANICKEKFIKEFKTI